MNIKAKGQLKHHFWGNYCADIVLLFESESDALLALPILNSKSPHIQWKQGVKTKTALMTCVAALPSYDAKPEDVDSVKIAEDILESFGADRKKIGSLKYSVDYGEVFSIALEVEHPDQLQLAIK